MIRRAFRHFSGILAPRPHLLAAIRPEPGSTPTGPPLPPSAAAPLPEWLREWQRIPRLELTPEGLAGHGDPRQRSIAASIFQRIDDSTPFTFRYLGGSQPGRVRRVLPVQLFGLDDSGHCCCRGDSAAALPGPATGAPIFLLAWCLSRNAPRTFRLDRMHTSPAMPPPPTSATTSPCQSPRSTPPSRPQANP